MFGGRGKSATKGEARLSIWGLWKDWIDQSNSTSVVDWELELRAYPLAWLVLRREKRKVEQTPKWCLEHAVVWLRVQGDPATKNLESLLDSKYLAITRICKLRRSYPPKIWSPSSTPLSIQTLELLWEEI